MSKVSREKKKAKQQKPSQVQPGQASSAAVPANGQATSSKKKESQGTNTVQG